MPDKAKKVKSSESKNFFNSLIIKSPLKMLYIYYTHNKIKSKKFYKNFYNQQCDNFNVLVNQKRSRKRYPFFSI